MNQGNTSLSRKAGGRDGIALVVTLGFLAVLVIMVVGFAVSMRVERLAARNYLDLVRAREMTRAALTRAMAQLESDTSVGAMYPGFYTWSSPVSASRMTNVLSGTASNYVPGFLMVQARAASANVGWDPVISDSKRLGSAAWLTVDSSGLIDVHMSADTNIVIPVRGLGAHVNEMRLDPLVLTDVWGNATNLIIGRRVQVSGLNNPWYRLETMAEVMTMLARGWANAMPLKTNNGYAINFFTYSHAPPGWYDAAATAVRKPVYVGGSPADLIAQEAAIKAEMNALDPTVDADQLFLNLIDYVDDDNAPGNRDTGAANNSTFCTEAVPMFSEFVVSNRVTGSGSGTNRNEWKVSVELWYPFGGKTNTHNYKLTVSARYDQTALNPADILISGLDVPGPWLPGTFRVVHLPDTTAWNQSAADPAVPDLNAARVRLFASLSEDTGDIVDKVPGTGLMTFNMAGFTSSPTGATMSVEVNDPRINWEQADWQARSAGTLGSVNASCTYTNADADGTTLMYVANRPLQTPGEIGLLLYSATKPWKTLPLYGNNAMRVLDRFVTRPLTNDWRGLINVNSADPAVIATVFNGMPIEHFPGEVRHRLTVAQAQKFANTVVLSKTAVSAFQNLSDLKNLDSAAMSAVVGGVFTNIALRESAICNSANLMTVRQNLFTIFVGGQATDEKGTMVAEQRGVAVVWRDPYPDSTGRHPMFVRNFKWLTE